MNKKDEKLTQEKIDEIFTVVNKLRRVMQRELSEKEAENLIYRLRGIA